MNLEPEQIEGMSVPCEIKIDGRSIVGGARATIGVIKPNPKHGQLGRWHGYLVSDDRRGLAAAFGTSRVMIEIANGHGEIRIVRLENLGSRGLATFEGVGEPPSGLIK